MVPFKPWILKIIVVQVTWSTTATLKSYGNFAIGDGFKSKLPMKSMAELPVFQEDSVGPEYGVRGGAGRGGAV